MINVAHIVWNCSVLGPGRRVVLWVRGCSIRCPGCVAGPILDPWPATPIAVDALASRILALRGVDGVTFSGGEPTEQADGLASLCERLRAERDLSLMSYSGRTLEELRAAPELGRFLGCLDILVDGPYHAERHADLLWRGSDNQRVHLLTDRHADWADRLDGPSAGIEVHLRGDGMLFWAGVPTQRFEASLRAGLDSRGISLKRMGGVWS